MSSSAVSRFAFGLLFFMIALTGPGLSAAESASPASGPARYGIAGSWGQTFDPVDDIRFFQAIGIVMWDYDPIWRSWAPKSMKFKIEASAGTAYHPDTRAMLSLGIVAHYDLDFLSGARLTPYLEGGLGAMYTDFQVRDPDPPYESQGSRINFNPVVGIGVDFKPKPDQHYFATFRLSHLSNAGLNSENRGVNSIVFQVGRFFDIGG